jgi:hypothetical protein
MIYKDSENNSFTVERVSNDPLDTRVKLTKKNIFGKTVSKALPCNSLALVEWLLTPRGVRPVVQNAFPKLNASEREFLLTGMTDEEWDETFPEDNE